MVKKEHYLLALMATALTVLTAGCYTVVDTAAGRGPAAVERERIVYVERVPAHTEEVSAEEIEAEDAEEYEYEAEAERDASGPGLQQDKYLRKYTQYEEDGGRTIINNYYYDEPEWYNTWYSRYWYDPWYWDTCIRPYRYRPYVHIGYTYDPFYWDTWSWNVGWSWGWYEPWHWHEPWYWHTGWAYAYNPWYYRPWYYYNYDHWYHGGGGGGNGGGDVVNGPRKIRPDRLAGFGSGRGTGGIVTTGGSTTEKSVPGETVNGRTMRRDSRDGFGTVTSRRRSPVEVTSGTTEKPAGETSGTVTPSRRGRDTGDTENSTHQRVRSGETTRRVRSETPETLLDRVSRSGRSQNDAQVDGTARVERQTPENRNGENTVRKPSGENSDRRRPQTRVWIRRDSGEYNNEARSGKTGSEESTSREVTRRSAPQSDSGNRSSDNSSEGTVQRRSSDNSSSERVSRPSSSSSGRSGSSTPSVSRSTPSSGRSSGVSSGRSSGGSSGGSSGRSSGRSSGGNSRPSTSQSGSRRR